MNRTGTWRRCQPAVTSEPLDPQRARSSSDRRAEEATSGFRDGIECLLGPRMTHSYVMTCDLAIYNAATTVWRDDVVEVVRGCWQWMSTAASTSR
jgi:hypothetical protein